MVTKSEQVEVLRQAISQAETILQFWEQVQPNSGRLYGSVTAQDIVQRIQTEYGVLIDKAMLSMEGAGEDGRIKDIGEYTVTISDGEGVSVSLLMRVNKKE